MKIAFLGGTFDPIHHDHLAMAKQVLNQVDRVEFLPAGQPWQKPNLQTSSQHRLNMLHLALESLACPQFNINTIELERQGPSYTVETLQACCQPPHHYYWVMGADQFRKLPTWHRYLEIFHYADLMVLSRGKPITQDEWANSPLGSVQSQIQFIPFEDSLDISSTRIRQLVQAGEPIDHLVPASVAEYIQVHGLYQI